MAAKPAQRRRRPLVMILVGLLALGVAAIAVLLAIGRGPKPIRTANILGETELCQSCHPVAEHETIAGHPKLAAIGCTPCHGGDASKLDKKSAHAPALGAGRAPFLPKKQVQVACARCHVLGQVGGMEKIVLGQQSYLRGSCVGCHGPGHQAPEIGPSLRTVPQKPVTYLKRWLLDSRAVLATASMWSLRDATYRQLFGNTPGGKKNLQALISYVLMAADEHQRRRYSAYAQRPKLRIDRPCVDCHGASDAKVKGQPHRCTMLRASKQLSCKRCHARKDTQPGSTARMCPQVAAAVHLCETCHLRQEDGVKQLLLRARRLSPP